MPPLPPSSYRLGRSAVHEPYVVRSFVPCFLLFVYVAFSVLFIRAPPHPPPHLLVHREGERERDAATAHELSGIAENWGQFSSAGGSVRKVKLGASLPFFVFETRRGGTRCPRELCPRPPPSGTWRARTNWWLTHTTVEKATFEIERGKRSVKEEESGDGTICGAFIFRPRRPGIFRDRNCSRIKKSWNHRDRVIRGHISLL